MSVNDPKLVTNPCPNLASASSSLHAFSPDSKLKVPCIFCADETSQENLNPDVDHVENQEFRKLLQSLYRNFQMSSLDVPPYCTEMTFPFCDSCKKDVIGIYRQQNARDDAEKRIGQYVASIEKNVMKSGMLKPEGAVTTEKGEHGKLIDQILEGIRFELMLEGKMDLPESMDVSDGGIGNNDENSCAMTTSDARSELGIASETPTPLAMAEMQKSGDNQEKVVVVGVVEGEVGVSSSSAEQGFTRTRRFIYRGVRFYRVHAPTGNSLQCGLCQIMVPIADASNSGSTRFDKMTQHIMNEHASSVLPLRTKTIIPGRKASTSTASPAYVSRATDGSLPLRRRPQRSIGLSCQSCNETFYSELLLEEHYESVHSRSLTRKAIANPTMDCGICGKPIRGSYINMVAHKFTHKNDEERHLSIAANEPGSRSSSLIRNNRAVVGISAETTQNSGSGHRKYRKVEFESASKKSSQLLYDGAVGLQEIRMTADVCPDVAVKMEQPKTESMDMSDGIIGNYDENSCTMFISMVRGEYGSTSRRPTPTASVEMIKREDRQMAVPVKTEIGSPSVEERRLNGTRRSIYRGVSIYRIQEPTGNSLQCGVCQIMVPITDTCHFGSSPYDRMTEHIMTEHHSRVQPKKMKKTLTGRKSSAASTVVSTGTGKWLTPTRRSQRFIEFSCQNCNAKFASKLLVEEHNKLVHTPSPRKANENPTNSAQRMDCDICGKSIRGVYTNLMAHKFSHKNDEERLVAIAANEPGSRSSMLSRNGVGSIRKKKTVASKSTGSSQNSRRGPRKYRKLSSVWFDEEMRKEKMSRRGPTANNKCQWLCNLCGRSFSKQNYYNIHMKWHAMRKDQEKANSSSSGMSK